MPFKLCVKNLQAQPMEKPFISIIIPVYNAERYFYKCLQSIKSQAFKDWECLIIDDGSPDDSHLIAKQFCEEDKRFRYFHKENGGLSDTRNYGLNKAKGEYISFIDSDDYLFDEYALAEMVSKAKNNPSTEVIVGKVISEDSAGKRYPWDQCFYSDALLTDPDEIKRLVFYPQIPSNVWNNIYRRDFIERNGLRFVKGILHEDAIFTFQLFTKAKIIGFSKHYFVVYNVHNPTSITNTNSPKHCRDRGFVGAALINTFDELSTVSSLPPEAFAYYTNIRYYFLKNPKYQIDKAAWIEAHDMIRKAYRQCKVLKQHQEKFKYPGRVAYFAYMNAKKFKPNSLPYKILSKFVTF